MIKKSKGMFVIYSAVYSPITLVTDLPSLLGGNKSFSYILTCKCHVFRIAVKPQTYTCKQ